MKREQRTHYRSVFISDLHLGSRASKALELLNFLKSVDCEFLYLLGDVFELLNPFKWDENGYAVIRQILKMMKHGTKVVYVPGNHDEQIRNVIPFDFGSDLRILDECVHTTADGRKLLLIHGDKFDFVVGNMKWLTVLGSHAYDVLLRLNGIVHATRMKLGFRRYWSLSAFMKARTKRAISFVQDFEKAAVMYAAKQGCDGVVCGHIHTPRMDERDGVLYLNCGDWVESMSALVEDSDGTMRIVR